MRPGLMDVIYTSFVSLMSLETSGSALPSKFSLLYSLSSFNFGMSCLLERFNLQRSSAVPKLALLLRNKRSDSGHRLLLYSKSSFPTCCSRLIPYSRFHDRHAKNSVTRDSLVHARDFIITFFQPPVPAPVSSSARAPLAL